MCAQNKKIKLLLCAIVMLTQATQGAEAPDAKEIALRGRFRDLIVQRAPLTTDEEITDGYNETKNLSVEQITEFVKMEQEEEKAWLQKIQNTQDEIEKKEMLVKYNFNKKLLALIKEIRGWVDV